VAAAAVPAVLLTVGVAAWAAKQPARPAKPAKVPLYVAAVDPGPAEGPAADAPPTPPADGPEAPPAAPPEATRDADAGAPAAVAPAVPPPPEPAAPTPAPAAAPTPAPAAACSAETFGTGVDFVSSPAEAYRRAKADGKLVFLLHVSGNFEDSCFT
jgi:hypothetical protein